MKPDERHPEESMLALLAGGDVAWWESLETRWHARFCPQCKHRIAQFRSARTELLVSDTDGRLPVDVQPDVSDTSWNLLEAEMRANIRLGLTAGALASRASGQSEEAAGIPSFAAFAPWRWAVVCGAMAFVLTAGWWLRSPGGAPQPMASTPALEIPMAEQSGQGAGQMAGRGGGIQLLVPVANVSRTETDFDGSTRSRVIDGETGQVTLQQVYVE
jgi:hypothetical protein